jgi:RimJ/RimL family protein N-acetyltransferase
MSRPPSWPATLPVLTDGVISLRLARTSDIDAIVAACQDPDIAYWTVVPSPYFREHAVQFVDGAQAAYDEGQRLPYVIADAVTDELIGSGGVHGIEVATASGEIGYWVAPGARGRNVATRSVRLQLQAGPMFGLHRFELLIEARNVASVAVARSAGCHDTGEVRENLIRGDVRQHMVWAYDVPTDGRLV